MALQAKIAVVDVCPGARVEWLRAQLVSLELIELYTSRFTLSYIVYASLDGRVRSTICININTHRGVKVMGEGPKSKSTRDRNSGATSGTF